MNNDITKNPNKTNIVFIGMAGCGKSTVGKEYARLFNHDFVDVDRIIENNQNKELQTILNDLGVHAFRKLEEKILLSLEYQNHVIATGGSAIYSQVGMEYLKQTSRLVLLDVSLPVLEQRVGDISERGFVKSDEQNFKQVFEERQPLYAKFADVTIQSTHRSVSAICLSLRQKLIDSFC